MGADKLRAGFQAGADARAGSRDGVRDANGLQMRLCHEMDLRRCGFTERSQCVGTAFGRERDVHA